MRKRFILALCLSLSVFAAGCSRSGSTAAHRSGGSQTARTTTEAEGTEYEASSETTTASASSASTSSAGSLYGSQSSSSDVQILIRSAVWKEQMGFIVWNLMVTRQPACGRIRQRGQR